MSHNLEHARIYLIRHPYQTLLCGLGICAALCLLTLSRASQRGAWQAVMLEFEGLGRDTALLYVHETRPLPDRFFEGLSRLCHEEGRHFVPVFEAHGRLNSNGQGTSGRMLTSTDGFFRLFQPQLESGRLLNSGDIHVDRLILGKTQADLLGVTMSQPNVKWRQTWYQVVGVIANLQSGGGQVHQFLDIGNAALHTIPAGARPGDGANLKFAVIQTAGNDDLQRFQQQFDSFVAGSGLAQLKLELRLPLRMRELAQNTGGVLQDHGLVISLTCLILSSLAVLISYQLQLKYRREEFGTLLALGASKTFIAKRLLAEVTVLSVVSGGLGLILGLIGVLLLQRQGDMAMAVGIGDIAANLLTLLAVALITGSVPALAAMRLDPIKLLRLHR